MVQERFISVIGLGRVGLPLALCFADRGLRVLGVDHDPGILESLRAGQMPFAEAGTQELLDRVRESGRLELADRAAEAARAAHEHGGQHAGRRPPVLLQQGFGEHQAAAPRALVVQPDDCRFDARLAGWGQGVIEPKVQRAVHHMGQIDAAGRQPGVVEGQHGGQAWQHPLSMLPDEIEVGRIAAGAHPGGQRIQQAVAPGV